MPDLLSNLFASDNGSSQQTDSQNVDTDGGLDLSPSVAIDHHAEGTYDNPDGSTTIWSSDARVGIGVELHVDAVTGVALGSDEANASDG